MTFWPSALALLLVPCANALAVPVRRLRAAQVAPRSWRLAACDGAGELDSGLDLNLLQTLLYDAIRREDYATASVMRDRIADAIGETVGGDVDWRNLEVPEWLADWLQRLGFDMATRVQMQALQHLAERDGATTRHRDGAIVAPTGSGKTFAYLLPLLKRISDDLLQEDLSRHLATALTGGRADRMRLDDAMPRPVLMVVVPTRELGVQISLLCYRLFGGSPGNPTLQPFSHPTRYQPGNAANMLRYTGPRRVRIAGLWDEQALYAAAYQDLLKETHVLVGTPEYLSRVAVSGKLRLHRLQAVVMDEADAVLPLESTTMLMRRLSEACEAKAMPKPQMILAGASISLDHVALASARGWLHKPLLVTPTGTTEFSEQFGSAVGAALGAVSELKLGQRVPSGATHQFIVVSGDVGAGPPEWCV